MDVLGLDHVDLTVTDIARSAAFYDRVLGELGFRRVPSSPSSTCSRPCSGYF